MTKHNELYKCYTQRPSVHELYQCYTQRPGVHELYKCHAPLTSVRLPSTCCEARLRNSHQSRQSSPFWSAMRNSSFVTISSSSDMRLPLPPGSPTKPRAPRYSSHDTRLSGGQKGWGSSSALVYFRRNHSHY